MRRPKYDTSECSLDQPDKIVNAKSRLTQISVSDLIGRQNNLYYNLRNNCVNVFFDVIYLFFPDK